MPPINCRKMENGDYAIFNNNPKVGKQYRIKMINWRTERIWRSHRIVGEINEETGRPFIRMLKETGEYLEVEKDKKHITYKNTPL